MYLSDVTPAAKLRPRRREYSRIEIRCRARIRIGNRQYAGYIHNISQGGAKLITISPIRGLGRVILRLPDLPPMRCQLRWTDAYSAGVEFDLALSASTLSEWVQNRSATVSTPRMEVAEIEELSD